MIPGNVNALAICIGRRHKECYLAGSLFRSRFCSILLLRGRRIKRFSNNNVAIPMTLHRYRPLFPPPPPPPPPPEPTVLAKVTRLAFTEGCFCGSLWLPSVVVVVVGGGCEASFGIAPLADAVLRIRPSPPPTQSSRRQKVVCNM